MALGESLSLVRDAIDVHRAQGGHITEVCLRAEDPQQNFPPQSDTIMCWRVPEDVRMDHALADGPVVSPYYGPMLAKIVAYDTDHTDVYRRLARALDNCSLPDLPTNRVFLRDCVAHPAFLSGDVSAAFIDRHFPAVMHQAAVPDAAACQTAAVLPAYLHRDTARYCPIELHGWTSSRMYLTLCRFMLDSEAIDMRVCVLDVQQRELIQDGGVTQVVVVSAGDDRVTLALGDAPHAVDCTVTASTCRFVLNDIEHTAIGTTYVRAERSGTQIGSGRISAPMNGRAVAVHVAEGEAVCASQVLLVVEAMKMEHNIAVSLADKVRGLFTQVGAQVTFDGLLMEIATA